MFKAVFVGSLSGWIVIHPDFTIVAPKHGVGLPKLQANTVLGVHASKQPQCIWLYLGHS